jgi:hypothetical protein
VALEVFFQRQLLGAIEMSRHTSRTYPDTPNQKCPDNSNRKCPDTFCVSGYFLLGNRKYPDSKKRLCECRDISCWAIGNVPTDKILSEHFLLVNRKCPDTFLNVTTARVKTQRALLAYSSPSFILIAAPLSSSPHFCPILPYPPIPATNVNKTNAVNLFASPCPM